MDYEKPKRKGLPRQNMWLFLLVGIVVGAGIASFVFLGVARDTTMVVESIDVVAQSIEPTVIASRLQDVVLAGGGNRIGILSDRNDGNSEFSLLTLSTSNNLAGDVRSIFSSPSYLTDAVISADGKYAVLSSFDSRDVTLLRLEDGAVLQQFSAHAGTINPRGTELAFVMDNTLMIEAIGGATGADRSVALAGNASEIRYSPDGSLIAVAVEAVPTGEWRLEVYQTQALANPPQVFSLDGIVLDMVFHPSGRYIAVTQGEGAQVFDLQGQGTRTFNFDPMGRARAVAFTPDGEWFVVGGGETSIGVSGIIYATRWYDATTPIPPDDNFLVPVIVGRHDHDVNSLVTTANGGVISAGSDGSVRLWSIEDMREVSRLQL